MQQRSDRAAGVALIVGAAVIVLALLTAGVSKTWEAWHVGGYYGADNNWHSIR